MAGKKKEIPSRHELLDYNHSVAGHAGTMCDAEGELFIKPCTQTEIDFYQSANADHPEFADLMPLFMGTLNLSDAADLSSVDEATPGPVAQDRFSEAAAAAVAAATSSQSMIPAAPDAPAASSSKDGASKDGVTWVPNKTKKIKTDQAVVLDNSSSGFNRPNILDAKLGKRLWADDAPQQKKTRFDKITAETTHGTLGFRIAGMRAYRGSLDKSELDAEDYRVYDKDYGRTTVNTGNIVDSFKKFIFNPAAGINEDLGKAVATAFLRDLRHVETTLASHESRMYSASLLFVFEGDGETLRAAIEANNAAFNGDVMRAGGVKDVDGVKSSSRIDSGIGMLPGEDGDDDDDDDDDGPTLPRIYDLKLIDFAHAQWTPGQGPDENSLMGVRSLIRIFEELAA